MEGPHDLRFFRHINPLLKSEDPSIIDIFNDPRIALVVLGGSNLQEWVNQHYLKEFRLPEVHIYDRDLLNKGKYKYQDARDAVNSRNDGSIAFLTEKRELENYLHFDAINEAFQKVIPTPFTFNLTDDCDVEGEIKKALNQKRINGRSLKHWLNDDAANKMSLEHLKDREGYEEIRNWFLEIGKRVN